MTRFYKRCHLSAAAATALLLVGLFSTSASARSFVEPGDCCGDRTFSDCAAPTRVGGPVECSRGHQLTHIGEASFSLGCIGVGCFEGDVQGASCDPDIADGVSTACTGDVRSCAAIPSTVACGTGDLCAATERGNIDFCPKPACLGGVINNADTDGDGLLDCWEDQGVDYDGDGVADLNLPAYGVNKNKKDILVEIDYFDCTVAGSDCAAATPTTPADTHTHKPSPATMFGPGPLDQVKTAFAAAPNTNPDGTTGINLVALVDEALPHRQNCNLDNSCLGVLKATHLGTTVEHMSALTLLAKRVTFHYSIWGHDLKPNVGNSGLGDVNGPNFIVSLGTGWSRTFDEQAGTFMHELGHNLNLLHGGIEDINNKPNYLSVMNYNFTFGLLPGAVLDYSRAALPSLFEVSGLNEPAGVGDGMLRTLFTCPSGVWTNVPASGAVNWDCKLAPNTATDLGVKGDINFDRRCLMPGVNKRIDSPLGGDDFLGEGKITVGPDGTLNTPPLLGSDDFVSFFGSVEPGQDGILQTVPFPGSDDVLQDQVVWDGPNRTCQTGIAMGSDDTANPDQSNITVGTVQSDELKGFNDWANLLFDFSPKLVGWSSAGPDFGTQEPNPERAARLRLIRKSTDVSISQRSARNADGTITYTVTMTNNGPDEAVGPTINNRVTNFATVTSCSAQSPGVCKVLGNYVAVGYATLASGASVTAQITIRLTGTPTAGTKNTVSAEVQSTDSARANNTSVACLAPPTFSFVPPTTTISSCNHPNIGTPTATSLCGLAITITNDAPAVFKAGATTVTWTARDAEGNSQTVTQKVFAVLGDDPACCPVGTNIIMGTSVSNSITGTAGSDCILGLGGDDIIDGRDGNDYISGGAGNDNINGGLGNDFIWGGTGIDTIDASGGDDFIDGGNEVNVCAGSSGINKIVGCTNPSGCTAACCSTNNCTPF